MDNKINRYPKSVIFLHPSKIKVLNDRGRKDFRNIKSLMDSIEKYGLIHPCVVVKDEEPGMYKLVAGERRYRSMCLLGWSVLPCMDRNDLTPLEIKEVELEENIRRENLSWEEEIELNRQIDELKRQLHGNKLPGSPAEAGGWTTKDTAEMLGMSKTALYKQIQFAKLLKENPEYKKEIDGLPLNAAIKKVEMIQLGEKNKRMVEQGLLKVSGNLILGDCRVSIKNIPDASVDLLLTDIPYGIERINEALDGKEMVSSGSYKGLIQDSDNLTKDEVVSILEELIPEVKRVLKPSAHFYIFHSFALYSELFSILRKNDLLPFDVPIIWDKGKTTGGFRGYEFMPCYEPIMYGHNPPKAKRFQLGGKLIVTYPILSSGDKLHTFEKPQELLSYLIKQSTNTGDLILDPFAGSASTLIAAKALNRSCIGFEINEKNYNVSLERLNHVV